MEREGGGGGAERVGRVGRVERRFRGQVSAALFLCCSRRARAKPRATQGCRGCLGAFLSSAHAAHTCLPQKSNAASNQQSRKEGTRDDVGLVQSRGKTQRHMDEVCSAKSGSLPSGTKITDACGPGKLSLSRSLCHLVPGTRIPRPSSLAAHACVVCPTCAGQIALNISPPMSAYTCCHLLLAEGSYGAH